MTEKERHPFKPYVPENATKLIIGTIPPPRFAKKELSESDVNFYYGSEDNNFWDIIGEIAGVDFKKENSIQEIEKRKNFLEKNSIGICDIVLKTNRRKPDSASDKDLIDIDHLNIINEILAEYPKIDTLLYTSDCVKTQMTQLLKEVYGREICHNKVKTVILDEKKEKNLKINNNVYKVFILYSPSPSANRRVSPQQRKEQYKKYLDI
ncbi:uracil-DNA glycosylase family protein [Hydrogenimonas cancrithermarum]|uniref:DNA-deoxyinosine glycosylase n=1 Tax=Hydrogenimonas cancrithermarum TaxID=2993563 RepID=A0ABN6WY33_9BACT|nr:hypothetical protein [Hydrogenimonas cancrithermarum]BDY13681.1 hypothetical protein HCR_19930 [Hydrogenimonas cancrithermarum]